METSVSITGISAAKTFRVYAFLLVSLFARPSFAEEDPASVIAALGLRESVVAARDMKDWEKPHKIVVLSDSAAQVAWFQEVAKDVTVVGARSPAEAMAQIADADGLVGSCNPDVINAGAKLRWIQTQAAGVEDCLAIPKVRNGGIILTNMQRVNGPNISATMSLIMVASPPIGGALASRSCHTWGRCSLSEIKQPSPRIRLLLDVTVRLYYETGAFAGIDPGAMWEDFRVGMEHLTHWERLAVVTDVEWIKHGIQMQGSARPHARRDGNVCRYAIPPTSALAFAPCTWDLESCSPDTYQPSP